LAGSGSKKLVGVTPEDGRGFSYRKVMSLEHKYYQARESAI